MATTDAIHKTVAPTDDQTDARPVPAALADDAVLAPGQNVLGFEEACAAADCVAETLARLADAEAV
jgi:hypothetical protein